MALLVSDVNAILIIIAINNPQLKSWLKRTPKLPLIKINHAIRDFSNKRIEESAQTATDQD